MPDANPHHHIEHVHKDQDHRKEEDCPGDEGPFPDMTTSDSGGNSGSPPPPPKQPPEPDGG